MTIIFYIFFALIFITIILSTIFLKSEYNVTSITNHIEIEKKKFAIFNELAGSILFILLFWTFGLVISDTMTKILMFLISIPLIFNAKKYLRKEKLVIIKNDNIISINDFEIEYNKISSLEFHERFSAGDSFYFELEVKLNNNHRISLLTIESEKEAKRIFKIIFKIIDKDPTSLIHRGLLGTKTSKMEI